MRTSKPIGLTASTGYQVGVRRTFPVPVDQAWKLITSPAGIQIWLGETPLSNIEAGRQYETRSGITGEIRVVNLHTNIRLGWKQSVWSKASTLQIRTIPVHAEKTTIRFHQENLPDADARMEMKKHWEEVLGKLSEVLKPEIR